MSADLSPWPQKPRILIRGRQQLKNPAFHPLEDKLLRSFKRRAVLFWLVFSSLSLGLLVSCATTPEVQLVQAGEGIPLTETVLQAARSELDLALEYYDRGDFAAAEQASVRAGRILYATEPPQDSSDQQYAELTSRLSLLTVRLNRFLYRISPELESEKFSLPVPYNPRIERQLDYYLHAGREEFALWLRRSGQYVAKLKEYFQSEGLPVDLVYLALVESGFNPRNRSSKQAVGLFQFVKDTAEMVGLREDSWTDERRHPEKAALAAIRHLKSLYKIFQDWDLAMAAYNAGASRVQEAIQAQGVRDYWQLALPPETETYVPKFYATLIIALEPELYGFNPDFAEQKPVEEVEVPGGVDFKVIADCIGVTVQVVADLNTELTKGCTPPGPESCTLLLPQGSGEKFRTNFAAWPNEKKFLTTEEINRRKFQGVYFIYQIKSGDSLYTIARKHHTTVNKLCQWNADARNNKYIFPGQKLRIYRLN